MKKLISLALAMMLMLSMAGMALAEDSDWAYIQGKGKMIVGITLFPPINYYDADGNLVGFDTELALAVGKKLGVEIEFQEINWSAKEIELNSKNIDVIWNGMSITEERKENMSVSKPYLYNMQAIVAKTDRIAAIEQSAEGLTVVSEEGSTGEGKVLGTIPDDDTVQVSAKEFFSKSTYVAVDSQAKAVMEVKAGTADVAVIDSVGAVAMVGEGTSYADLTHTLELTTEEYVVGCRKDSDLASYIDDQMKKMYDDGTLMEIAKEYGVQDAVVAQ